VAAHIPLDPPAPMRFEKRPRQLARHRPVGRRHRVLEVEDQCVGPAFEPLGELPLAVGGNEQERAHSHPRHLINAARRQIATVSPCWLSPTCSNSTMPASARDLLRRRLTTVVRAWIVSPWKTGFGNRTSLIPRLATVVPSVVSPTEMPITSPSVKMLLTSGRPNSVVLANSASRCSGCGFIVIVVNSTLSVSVTVRVSAWSKTWPSLNSSKYSPAIGLLLSDIDRMAQGPSCPAPWSAPCAAREQVLGPGIYELPPGRCPPLTSR